MGKINLDPTTVATLNAEGAKLAAPPKPLSNKMIQVVHNWVAKVLFGLSTEPTFKQQLFVWSSHAAIKASWAADYWQGRQRERTRN